MCHKVYIYIFMGFCTLSVSSAGGNTCAPPLLIQEVRDIACVDADLRTAMQRDDLLRKISNTNVFASLQSNDVIRSVKTMSFFNRDLTNSIEDKHTEYQEAGRDNYTLQVTSYPAVVEENSCKKNKTIDFKAISIDDSVERVSDKEDVFEIYADYSTTDKSPRTFQVRAHKGKLILCEYTNMSYDERLIAYCGKRSNSECERDLKKIPSCLAVDQQANTSSENLCVSLDDFSDLSKDLLMDNSSLEDKYCPDGCSYYTQTIQGVYKKSGTQDEYCSDNYLIVHCGPKKDESDYNLNIREITNICTDFYDVCQVHLSIPLFYLFFTV